jgi:hypothetical protein
MWPSLLISKLLIKMAQLVVVVVNCCSSEVVLFFKNMVIDKGRDRLLFFRLI